ncbi:hypothetical protein P3342_003730 [Pyrenophora teres f. teres]|nr:hypothetical protein P3342_003730 [Pyrenophora teres f. teres]
MALTHCLRVVNAVVGGLVALKILIGTTVMIPIFLLGEVTCLCSMGIVLMGGQKDGTVDPIVNSMFLLAGV